MCNIAACELALTVARAVLGFVSVAPLLALTNREHAVGAYGGRIGNAEEARKVDDRRSLAIG
jgi:hypothetical protein